MVEQTIQQLGKLSQQLYVPARSTNPSKTISQMPGSSTTAKNTATTSIAKRIRSDPMQRTSSPATKPAKKQKQARSNVNAEVPIEDRQLSIAQRIDLAKVKSRISAAEAAVRNWQAENIDLATGRAGEMSPNHNLAVEVRSARQALKDLKLATKDCPRFVETQRAQTSAAPPTRGAAESDMQH